MLQNRVMHTSHIYRPCCAVFGGQVGTPLI
nr:MAG TPA: hypothetical protein [Caudoviricetes sp.]